MSKRRRGQKEKLQEKKPRLERKGRVPIGKFLGFIIPLFVTLIIAYRQLYSSLHVRALSNSKNIFNEDFIIKNEGTFSAKNVKIITDGTVLTNFGASGARFLNVGDIYPKDHATTRLSDALRVPQNWNWKNASLCLFVSFSYKFYGTKEWKYGFIADKTARVNNWIKQPNVCKGVKNPWSDTRGEV
jgi:hypothetical protein